MSSWPSLSNTHSALNLNLAYINKLLEDIWKAKQIKNTDGSVSLSMDTLGRIESLLFQLSNYKTKILMGPEQITPKTESNKNGQKHVLSTEKPKLIRYCLKKVSEPNFQKTPQNVSTGTTATTICNKNISMQHDPGISSSTSQHGLVKISGNQTSKKIQISNKVYNVIKRKENLVTNHMLNSSQSLPKLTPISKNYIQTPEVSNGTETTDHKFRFLLDKKKSFRVVNPVTGNSSPFVNPSTPSQIKAMTKDGKQLVLNSLLPLNTTQKNVQKVAPGKAQTETLPYITTFVNLLSDKYDLKQISELSNIQERDSPELVQVYENPIEEEIPDYNISTANCEIDTQNNLPDKSGDEVACNKIVSENDDNNLENRLCTVKSEPEINTTNINKQIDTVNDEPGTESTKSTTNLDEIEDVQEQDNIPNKRLREALIRKKGLNRKRMERLKLRSSSRKRILTKDTTSSNRPQRNRKPNKRFSSPATDTIPSKSRRLLMNQKSNKPYRDNYYKIIQEELTSATDFLKSLNFPDDESSTKSSAEIDNLSNENNNSNDSIKSNSTTATSSKLKDKSDGEEILEANNYESSSTLHKTQNNLSNSLHLEKCTYQGYEVSKTAFEILKSAIPLCPVLYKLEETNEITLESQINDMNAMKSDCKPKAKRTMTDTIKSLMNKVIQEDIIMPSIEFDLPDTLKTFRIKEESNIIPEETVVSNMDNEYNVTNDRNQQGTNSNIAKSIINPEIIDYYKNIEELTKFNEYNSTNLNRPQEITTNKSFDHVNDDIQGTLIRKPNPKIDKSQDGNIYDDDASSTSSVFDEENPRGESYSHDQLPPVLSPENIFVISDDEAQDDAPPLSPNEIVPTLTPYRSQTMILPQKINQVSQKTRTPTHTLDKLSSQESIPTSIVGVSSTGKKIPLLVSKVQSLNTEKESPKKDISVPLSVSKITCHLIALSKEERNMHRKLPEVLRTWFRSKLNYFFKCPEFSCYFMTDTELKFQLHMNRNHNFGTNFIPCLYCNYKMSAEFYITHLMIRHAECNFRSKFCYYQAAKKEYVQIHYALFHQNAKCQSFDSLSMPIVTQRKYRPPQLPSIASVLKPHKCSCSKMFYCPKNYYAHLKLCQSTEKTNNKQQFPYPDYSCRYCSFAATNRYEVLIHISIEHPHHEDAIILRQHCDNITTNVEGPGILNELVILGSEVATDFLGNLGHIYVNILNKTVKDDKCSFVPMYVKQFKFKKYMNIPIGVSAAILYRCKPCNHHFENELTFKQHVYMHSTKQCGYCDFTANHIDDLMYHIRLHGYPLYMCGDCSFMTNRYEHINTHSVSHKVTPKPDIFLIRSSQGLFRIISKNMTKKLTNRSLLSTSIERNQGPQSAT